jgi:hypothetical protein
MAGLGSLPRGPIAGPINGAALNAAIGTPRSSALQRSASVPPTTDIGQSWYPTGLESPW